MVTSTEPVRLAPSPVPRRRIPVAVILALSFGSLVFLSVGGVLALSVGMNYRNTVDLLSSQSNLLVDAMEESLRDHMSGVESAVGGIAELYAQGAFDIDDDGAMNATLSGALSAVPEATGILIFTDDMMQRGVVRNGTGPGDAIRIVAPHSEESPQVKALLAERRLDDGRYWNDFVVNEYGFFANVSQPLSRKGVRKAWLAAPVELQTLSRITKDLSGRLRTHAFILDGDNRVLAHPSLAEADARTRGIMPLMPLGSFGDPVLAHYAERKPIRELGTDPNQNFQVSEINLGSGLSSYWRGDREYYAITREVTGYGERPWTIGAYFASSDIGDEFARAWLSGLLGLAALLLAVVAAILLGKRLSRPVQVIAGQAQRVANFDLDGVAPLPRSRVQELDDQASAFNAMLLGLRAFSTYIPRSLVAKLVRSGEIDAAESHEVIVTVMFTDIAGFTALSEKMGAAEAARLLNHHFAILCAAIDEQGGTVDKFLGDGMMAFFGAPDRLKGHAAAAVRAAAVIRDRLAADNQEAMKGGRPELRVRIGIHTGPVIVGNIGASDRVNYTIIGDTVNVSQRLQELGKTLAPDAATAILVSGETASRLDSRFETFPAGRHRLRGRGEATEVFLVGEVDAAVLHQQDASAA
ncbi:MAG: adenylate/guanylate cyclase domain-containing protein [Rhizobiaceae bacterium]|nr:adenylate/guanylate cyclase domain-containing protein [Rhizobiaceae bacterium]